MASFRDRAAAQTLNLISVAEMPEPAPMQDEKPKTGPGLMASLNTSKARVKELEERDQSFQASLATAHARIKELEEGGVRAELPVASLSPNPKQPRTFFEPEALAALALSISEVGLLQPVVVRVHPTDPGSFQLIAGERRWRAHQQLGMELIKAVVVAATDADMTALALVENVTREDLSDYEIGRALKDAEREFPNRTRMAEAMGMSRTNLYRYFSFDKLPQVILDDLTRNPTLLGGRAAYELSLLLDKGGNYARAATKELWPDVVLGRIQPSKLPEMVTALMHRRAAATTPSSKENFQLFAGREQVGSISKDGKNLSVKLKMATLTDVQETQIREFFLQLYKGSPPNS